MEKCIDSGSGPQLAALTAEEESARLLDERTWGDGQADRDAEAERCSSIDASIAGDSIIVALKAMSSEELDAWFNANVTDLASARAMLRRMFKIIVRRAL